MYSQERQQDDTQSFSTRKLGRRDAPSSSASARKLKGGEDIQIGRTRLASRNVQISDHRYLEKVFKNLRKKWNIAGEAPVIGIEALKTNVLVWESFMSTTMKAAGIGGEPIEFEWNIFVGLASLEILQKIQEDLQDRNLEPEDFEDQIIFMSMFNDIEWTKKGNSERCISNSEQVKKYAKRFSRGHWTFLELSVIHLKAIGTPQPLRTHNSCFERFTQQINSVSTEQSQAGVKSSVKGRMRNSRLRICSWQM